MEGTKSGQANPNPKDSNKFRQDMVAAEIAARDLARDLGYALETLKESTKALDKQAGVYKNLSKSSQLLNYIAKDNVNVAKDLAALYDSELQNSNDLLLKRNMLSTGLKGDYAQLLTTYMLENNITSIEDQKVQLLLKQLQHRQHINEETAKQVELTEAMAAWQEELHEELEGYSMGWEKLKSKIKAIATDPKVAKAFFAAEGIKTAVEGLEGMEKRFDALKQSGLSAGQAAEGTIKTISVASIVGLSDTQGVMQEMVTHYGNVNALSGDMVNDLGKMAVHMGITGQEAMKLNASLSQMPGETAESAKNAMEHVGHMAEMEGIAPGKIMKDMAGNTAEMARAGSKGAEAFGKSVINLHKMGVEMSTASKMADNLLDFETSINNQMEASMLLGRDINLDKARELALHNDIEGATKEVLANVGGAAEFNKLNRIQQDALAKSLGLSVEEMAKYIDAQEEQEKYHGEASSTWMNILGYTAEYSSKVGGFLKEHGLLMLAGLSYMKQYGGPMTMLKDGWKSVTGGIKGAWDSAKGMFQTITGGKDKMKDLASQVSEMKKKDPTLTSKDALAKIKGKGAVDGISDKTKEAAKATDDASKVKTGGSFKESMTDLAEGFKAMGQPGVFKGVLNTAVAGPALVAALPSIPFLLFMGKSELKQLESNFSGLGKGLSAMGSGKAAGGAIVLMLAAAASAVGMLGIPFLTTISTIGPGLKKGLKALAAGLESLANGAVAIGVGILSVLVLSVGAGMMMLGVGIGVAAAGMALFVASLSTLPFENLAALPIALYGVASGLGAMTMAGVGAMPVIGALIALANVAPALTGLATALMGDGGGAGGGGESEELRELKKISAAMSTPVIVKLDGKVLAEGSRKSTATSGLQ